MRLKHIAAAGIVAAALVVTVSTADARIGVVLLHGNGINGLQFSDMVGPFAEAGFGLETPDMCWSDLRQYDKTPIDCMADVDKAVARLKADGYDQIVIAGHSMGGINTELYAANHPGLAGVMLFAPAEDQARPTSDANVQLALSLVAEGLGDVRTTFPNGAGNPLKTIPSAWLGYFGPDSLLDDAFLLPRITAPVFWAAGTRDPSQKNALDRFNTIPASPLNHFVLVEADHYQTPDVALTSAMAWLNQLQMSLDQAEHAN